MNKGKMIRLTDGTVIEAKMNFGTIYYLDQIGGSKLGRRIDKLEKIGKATDSDKMNFAAKLIYAMVSELWRSFFSCHVQASVRNTCPIPHLFLSYHAYN